MNNRQTYLDARAVKLDQPPRLIWLASWYPSSTDQYNGDFIQRHAEAVSALVPVMVIHTIHDPKSFTPVRYELTRRGMLTEIVVYFRHSGQLGSITSRIAYNHLFYHHTQSLLSHLFRTYGKPDCLHVHVPMKMGRVALWAMKKWDVPYFVSEQSSAYLPGVEDRYANRSFFYRYSVKAILRKARAVSNVSRSLADILQQISGRDDIAVIRNVADSGLFTCRTSELPVFTFLHVSTLKEQKNVKGMLNAFGALQNLGYKFALHVVGGDAETLNAIRIHYANASWLTLFGTVEHRLVAFHMQQAHCLVMFSRDENFPCVIVEGLSCGLPVITSNAGGCAEAIVPENGVVVPSGDEKALLVALEHMITHYNRYDRQYISTEAASRYSFEKVGNDFIQFYRNSGIDI